jgi:hypothetical protein
MEFTKLGHQLNDAHVPAGQAAAEYLSEVRDLIVGAAF